jgi:hypothetical protein
MPVCVGEPRPEFRVITALQHREIERRGTRKESDVLSIASRIALELGKSEIVRLEPEKPQPAKRRGNIGINLSV